jgi:hypothetical protein
MERVAGPMDDDLVAGLPKAFEEVEVLPIVVLDRVDDPH